MKHPSWRSLVPHALAAALLLTVAASLPAAPSPPADSTPTAGEKAADNLWTQMMGAYARLDSFRETITQQVSGVRTIGTPPKTVALPPLSITDHVTFQKPNRFRVETELTGAPQGPIKGDMVSDGTEVAVYSGALNQYRKEKSPSDPGKALQNSALRAALFDGPDAFLPTPSVQVYRSIQQQVGAKSLAVTTKHDTLDNTPVDVIQVEITPNPDAPASSLRLEKFQETWYLSAKDHLPIKKVQKQTVSHGQTDEAQKDDVTVVRTFSAREINPKIEKAAFSFKPPANARLVTDWDVPGAPEQKAPAPASPPAK